MKNIKFSFLLAIALIAFTGSLRAEFLYVSYGKGLLSFSINPYNAALSKLPGTPKLFAGGTGPLTLDRTGHLLYLSTGGTVFSDGYSYGDTIHWREQPSGRSDRRLPKLDGGRSLS
jgi:hypothetical protein